MNEAVIRMAEHAQMRCENRFRFLDQIAQRNTEEFWRLFEAVVLRKPALQERRDTVMMILGERH